MRIVLRCIAAALAAWLCAAAACPSAPEATPIAATEVVSGCAGGATGGGGGVALRPDGALYRWQRATAGASETRTLVRTDTALAGDVLRRLTAMHFLDIAYSEPSNMTCFVRVKTDAGEHEVAWPHSDTRAPREVRDLFDRLQAAGGGA